MSLPRIIGITGYARHGKDTLANVLTRELGYNRLALADKMKELALQINPIVKQYSFPKHPTRLATLVELVGWEKAKEEPEVRRFLQELGTRIRKMMGDDVWIEALVRGTKGFYSPSERKIVIPDIRFPNEAQWIKRVGVLWHVFRPDFDNGVGVTHDSERHIGSLHPDETLINVGSKSDFQDKVLRILKNKMATVNA